MPSLQIIKDTLEASSYAVTILGVPVAIYLFYQEKRKERREREYGTYNALDDKYIEFLNLCLNNTDLNIYYVKKSDSVTLTLDQERKQLLIFEILISILERAYLMYQDHNTQIKKEQWEGWNAYMHEWMGQKNFQESWRILGHQWEFNFIKHMNDILKGVEA
jgi:hypothetical protein